MIPRIYTYAFHPDYFARRSGMHRLGEYVDAVQIEYSIRWKTLEEKSWTLGNLARRTGIHLSGSTWNATVPWLDEWRFCRAVRGGEPAVAHFIYAEFTVPRLKRLFHRRGARVVATYHASPRRLPEVVGRVRDFRSADWITLVSKTQEPFFRERGFPAERLRVILHGVDTEFFHPDLQREPEDGRPLQGLIVGVTERDHAFLAGVMKRLPAGVMELRVSTARDQQMPYRDISNCRLLEKLSDEELLSAYQQADLLVMPLLDCTANNVALEAMACGTPLLTNRVGGIPEYVSPDSSFVLDGKREDEWVDLLIHLARDRKAWSSRRAAARHWAEQFDWRKVAAVYRNFYAEVVA